MGSVRSAVVFVVLALVACASAGVSERSTLMRQDLSLVHPHRYGEAKSDTTLAAAIADLGTDPYTLMIPPGTWTIANDLTIPPHVHLFVAAGAQFSVAAGRTLTIQSPVVSAPARQIFTGSGLVVWASSQIPDLVHYGASLNDETLTKALAALGVQPHTLLIPPGTWTIGNALTIPAHLSLIVADGATFSISAGVVLTIQSDTVTAPARHIFTGSGTVSWESRQAPNIHHWGAKCDGTDDAPALNATITAVQHAEHTIQLCAGTMGLGSPVDINPCVGPLCHGITLQGHGRNVTQLVRLSPSTPMIRIMNQRVVLRDFTITTTDVIAVAGGDGIITVEDFTVNFIDLASITVEKQWNGFVLRGCAFCTGRDLIANNNNANGFLFPYHDSSKPNQWEIHGGVSQMNVGAGYLGIVTDAVIPINAGPFLSQTHSFCNGNGGYRFHGSPTQGMHDIWLVRPISSYDSVGGIIFDTYGTAHKIVSPWVEGTGQCGEPLGWPVQANTTGSTTASGISLINNARGVTVLDPFIWGPAGPCLGIAPTTLFASVIGGTMRACGAGQHADLQNRSGIYLQGNDAMISGVSFVDPVGSMLAGIFIEAGVLRASIGQNNFDPALDRNAWVTGNPVPGGAQIPLGLTVHTKTGHPAFSLLNPSTGVPTPSKHLTIAPSGALTILNDNFSSEILTLTDAGALRIPGVPNAPGGSRAACFDTNGTLYRAAGSTCP